MLVDLDSNDQVGLQLKKHVDKCLPCQKEQQRLLQLKENSKNNIPTKFMNSDDVESFNRELEEVLQTFKISANSADENKTISKRKILVSYIEHLLSKEMFTVYMLVGGVYLVMKYTLN